MTSSLQLKDTMNSSSNASSAVNILNSSLPRPVVTHTPKFKPFCLESEPFVKQAHHTFFCNLPQVSRLKCPALPPADENGGSGTVWSQFADTERGSWEQCRSIVGVQLLPGT